MIECREILNEISFFKIIRIYPFSRSISYLEIGMWNLDISKTFPFLQVNELSWFQVNNYYQRQTRLLYLESGLKKRQNVLKKVIKVSVIYKYHSVQWSVLQKWEKQNFNNKIIQKVNHVFSWIFLNNRSFCNF